MRTVRCDVCGTTGLVLTMRVRVEAFPYDSPSFYLDLCDKHAREFIGDLTAFISNRFPDVDFGVSNPSVARLNVPVS